MVYILDHHHYHMNLVQNQMIYYDLKLLLVHDHNDEHVEVLDLFENLIVCHYLNLFCVLINNKNKRQQTKIRFLSGFIS